MLRARPQVKIYCNQAPEQLLLDGMERRRKDVVGKPIWELYSSIFKITSNQPMLDALYDAASHAQEQDTYESTGMTQARSVVSSTLRRWLRCSRLTRLVPWELFLLLLATAAGIAVGLATQFLSRGNAAAASIAGIAAGTAFYAAIRYLASQPLTADPSAR